MNILVFLGAPGSGKGTQSDMLVHKNNYEKISTGDLLRDVSSSGSDLGKEIKEIMKSGGLVSDEIVAKLIRDKLSLSNNSISNFIFDGFPRTLNQAKILEDIINDIDQFAKVSILLLQIDKESVLDRISGRFVCGDCKENYHERYKKSKIDGVCDLCGSKNMIKRDDDKPETVVSRIDSYNREIEPIIEFYQKEYGVNEIIGNKHYSKVYQEILNSVNI
ncbi:MAG: nucleoside monophosphate kinase [Rickettsiales bacterium]|jgi:adenylate kinase|nr:nucleoside monophosphate kinase [Rickettsiales bacterium]